MDSLYFNRIAKVAANSNMKLVPYTPKYIDDVAVMLTKRPGVQGLYASELGDDWNIVVDDDASAWGVITTLERPSFIEIKHFEVHWNDNGPSRKGILAATVIQEFLNNLSKLAKKPIYAVVQPQNLQLWQHLTQLGWFTAGVYVGMEAR